MRLLAACIAAVLYSAATAVRWTGVGERPPVVLVSPWTDGTTPQVVEVQPQPAAPQRPARKTTGKLPAVDLLQTLRGVDASKVPADPIGEKQLRVWCEQHLIGRSVTIAVVVRDVKLEDQTLFHADDWQVRVRVNALELEEWSHAQDTGPLVSVEPPKAGGGERREASWALRVASTFYERNFDFEFHINGSDKARAFQALDDKAPHTLTGVVKDLLVDSGNSHQVIFTLTDYAIDGLK